MAHWNSRGLRGSSFEEIINFTNERYRQSGLALFQKIPTPITPVRMDEETRTITLAYFEKQSTVDYIGVAQGIAAFEEKYSIRQTGNLLHYLEAVSLYLEETEKQGSEKSC